MIRQWKDSWMHNAPTFTPAYVALAALVVDGEMKALIQFRGPSQRQYALTLFEQGARTEAEEPFQSLEDAKAAV